MGLADKYHDLAMFERTVTLAWTQAHIQQYHLGMEPSEAHLFQDLASRILYSQKGLRAAPEVLARNVRGAPGLWAYGISGDLPIVLIRIDEEDEAAARSIIERYSDKDFSLVDATSFVIMDALGIRTAFAFDINFRQYGFTTL